MPKLCFSKLNISFQSTYFYILFEASFHQNSTVDCFSCVLPFGFHFRSLKPKTCSLHPNRLFRHGLLLCHHHTTGIVFHRESSSWPFCISKGAWWWALPSCFSVSASWDGIVTVGHFRGLFADRVRYTGAFNIGSSAKSRIRDFSSSLQHTFLAAECRLFRIEFIFCEAHSVDIFSVQYVASKDIQTSDLKCIGNTKLRETISEIRISSRLMSIDVIETERCVCTFSC